MVTETDKKCGTCGGEFTVEDGEAYVYRCPECGREGCDNCMPAGHGCLCPECEGGL